MADTKQALPTCNAPAATHEAHQFTLTLPTVVFINLTITTFTTIYRAHQHHDTTLLVFIVFIYGSYFVLDRLVIVYSRIPKGEKSTKKEVLRFTMWFLPTAVLLGFALEFGTFMPITVVVLMYCVAIAGSSLILYVHYIYDDQKGHACADQKSNNKHEQVPIAQNMV